MASVPNHWNTSLFFVPYKCIRYLHAHFTRIRSSYSKSLREKKEVFDFWWEDMISYLWFCVMIIYISLRTCWKLRFSDRNTQKAHRSVFLMQKHPLQNSGSGCNCSVPGGSDWGLFYPWWKCQPVLWMSSAIASHVWENCGFCTQCVQPEQLDILLSINWKLATTLTKSVFIILKILNSLWYLVIKFNHFLKSSLQILL